MSNIYSSIIDQQDKVMSDMSTIIGRYKGSVEVYKNELKTILHSGGVGEHEADMLKYIICSMDRLVAENEELWENRGKREAQAA